MNTNDPSAHAPSKASNDDMPAILAGATRSTIGMNDDSKMSEGKENEDVIAPSAEKKRKRQLTPLELAPKKQRRTQDFLPFTTRNETVNRPYVLPHGKRISIGGRRIMGSSKKGSPPKIPPPPPPPEDEEDSDRNNSFQSTSTDSLSLSPDASLAYQENEGLQQAPPSAVLPLQQAPPPPAVPPLQRANIASDEDADDDLPCQQDDDEEGGEDHGSGDAAVAAAAAAAAVPLSREKEQEAARLKATEDYDDDEEGGEDGLDGDTAYERGEDEQQQNQDNDHFVQDQDDGEDQGSGEAAVPPARLKATDDDDEEGGEDEQLDNDHFVQDQDDEEGGEDHGSGDAAAAAAAAVPPARLKATDDDDEEGDDEQQQNQGNDHFVQDQDDEEGGEDQGSGDAVAAAAAAVPPARLKATEDDDEEGGEDEQQQKHGLDFVTAYKRDLQRMKNGNGSWLETCTASQARTFKAFQDCLNQGKLVPGNTPAFLQHRRNKDQSQIILPGTIRRLKKDGDRYIAQYIHMVCGEDFEIRTRRVTANFLNTLFTDFAMKLISACENSDSWLVVNNPAYHQSIRNNLTYKKMRLLACRSYYELSGDLPADWGLEHPYTIPFENPFDELQNSTSQRLSNDNELQENVDNNPGKWFEITAGFNGASDPGYEYTNQLVPVPPFALQDPHDNDDYNCYVKAFGAGLSVLPQYDAESLTNQLLKIPVGDEATYVNEVQRAIKPFHIKLKHCYTNKGSIKKLLTEIFTQKQDSTTVVTLLKVNAGGNLHTVSVSPKGYMFEVTLEHALKPTMENLELICDCGVHVLKAWVFTAGKGKRKKKDQI